MNMRTRDSELTEFLYGGRYPKGYPTGCEKQLIRKLQMLKAAHALQDLKVPPGNRLEALSGNLLGHWSIRVNQQYRLVFLWDDEAKEAIDVYFCDYHS
ncbi:Killer protein [Bifidobacterium callimiconis]|uniref:Killer protein n=2 Tax=Bifidobacterium callimiconis TaxID=2306973 RepID=A0A430FBE3_9BIFI|nr:Killer protein [Bifidobacterium callimiconis]